MFSTDSNPHFREKKESAMPLTRAQMNRKIEEHFGFEAAGNID
jgi:hypothetical protein